jgi:hypothetical protein
MADDPKRKSQTSTSSEGVGETYSSTPGDRTQEESALAVEENQEKARKAITAKDQTDPDMPKPPNTAGMGLVQAAAANADYNRRLAAYRARPAVKASPSPSPSPAAQAAGLRGKQ